MNRLPVPATLALPVILGIGCFALSSCPAPYPPPYRGPNGPMGPGGPVRGDGYGDPYANGPGFRPRPGYDDGYRDSNGAPGYDDGGGAYGDGNNPDGGSYTQETPAPPRPGQGNPAPGNASGNPSTGGKKTEYPTATKTATPGRVLSPYKPYNVIDVNGIQSGKLAKDPSTGEIFRVP